MKNHRASPPKRGTVEIFFDSPRLGGLGFCLNQMALVTVNVHHLELLPGDNNNLQGGLQEFLESLASVAMHAALDNPHELFLFLTALLFWDRIEGINYFF